MKRRCKTHFISRKNVKTVVKKEDALKPQPTFSPSINKKSKMIMQEKSIESQNQSLKSGSLGALNLRSKSGDGLHAAQQTKRSERMLLLKNQLDQKEMAECTFKPSISHT